MSNRCPKCEFDNPDDTIYCGHCAAPLKPSTKIPIAQTEPLRNGRKPARKIRHKNVCQMFDLNTSEGTYYITMEYVSGQDLKGLIRQSGRLAVETAGSIPRQVVSGR